MDQTNVPDLCGAKREIGKEKAWKRGGEKVTDGFFLPYIKCQMRTQ